MDRRLEDRALALLLNEEGRFDGVAAEVGDCSFEVIGYASAGEGARAGGPDVSPALEGSDSVLLLRARSGGREVLVAGTAVQPMDRGAHSWQHFARAAAVWREQWMQIWKRSRLSGKLISFFDALNSTETPQEVCDVVEENARRIVGAYQAMLLLAGPPAMRGAIGGADAAAAPGSSWAHSRFSGPGLISLPDFLREMEPWLEELDPLVGDPRVTMLAHVPFGGHGVLFLAERRSDRIFDADDWMVLSTIAEQGDRALNRALHLQHAQELSLTDPLTGMANRREMEVVLRHAWAAAERGEGLAVMMLDLDSFKVVNDTHGHAAGDQVLCMVADCLRQETRGADAVIRYGGDEFLVIMPRGDETGARSLVARVRERLAGCVGLTEGIACYARGYRDSGELIRMADEDLYRNKVRRAPARLPGADSPV